MDLSEETEGTETIYVQTHEINVFCRETSSMFWWPEDENQVKIIFKAETYQGVSMQSVISSLVPLRSQPAAKCYSFP